MRHTNPRLAQRYRYIADSSSSLRRRQDISAQVPREFSYPAVLQSFGERLARCHMFCCGTLSSTAKARNRPGYKTTVAYQSRTTEIDGRHSWLKQSNPYPLKAPKGLNTVSLAVQHSGCNKYGGSTTPSIPLRSKKDKSRPNRLHKSSKNGQ